LRKSSKLALVTLVAFGLLPLASSAARVHLAVRPARALPGAAVNVRGSGFPKRARVVLFLGSKRVRTLRAGRRGSFRTRFRVPRKRPRLYQLTARSGRIVVKLRFRLLRSPPPKSPPSPPPSTPPATVASPAPEPDGLKLIAAGDIACAPPATQTTFECHQGVTSDRVLALNPDAVVTLGDDQYEKGELTNFQQAFDPSWGRFKSLIRPGIGNHEYLNDPQHDTADGYFQYFGTAAAGDPAKGYYSYSLGNWRLFALNTGDLGFNSGPDDCFPVSCAAGSEQEQWLKGELDALPADTCVLAYWHHPRYSSYLSRSHVEVSPLFQDLYDHGAELALTGHVHNYERFAPMDAAANSDDSYGVREFVVGTGGRGLTGATGTAPNSEKLDLTHFGVLELFLGQGRYDYRFIGEDGAVLDQGGRPCHGPHP
jgi:calcineurin-like phosphoesterase family protein